MDKLIKAIRIHKGININNPILAKYDKANSETLNMQLDLGIVVSNVVSFKGKKHLIIEGQKVQAIYKN